MDYIQTLKKIPQDIAEIKEKLQILIDNVERRGPSIPLISDTELCAQLGINKRTSKAYRDRGLIKYIRPNRGMVYYRLEDVRSFIDNSVVKEQQEPINEQEQ